MVPILKAQKDQRTVEAWHCAEVLESQKTGCVRPLVKVQPQLLTSALKGSWRESEVWCHVAESESPKSQGRTLVKVEPL